MQDQSQMKERLEQHGIHNPGRVYWNLSIPELYEEVVRRNEGQIAENGTLVSTTGKHTGRSPNDRFVVKDSATENEIWWGPINQPFDPKAFDSLHQRLLEYIEGRDLFVRDLFVCAHPKYRMPVRIITELAWHSVFVNNLFVRPRPDEIPHQSPEFTVISIPSFQAVPEQDGTRTGTFIILNMSKKLAIIGGTQYAGEIKKSVFTMLNFLLPAKGVFPMHCSANTDSDGDVALFFGLSGTGKTTLSADPERELIGDDEHGWFEGGVFNFEGGCYAKMIGLKAETEPEIYKASLQFGSVLENVVVNPEAREIDFESDAITENTRGAYPITHLERVVPSGVGGVPTTIFMLTYDAFGVLPPISKLTKEQAGYYFLLGYTAKVAGTERGVSEPKATFSTCFGAPFMPRPPKIYAEMLKNYLEKNKVNVWLLNTGITGGPYGVGKRMPLPDTRKLVRAAINGSLEKEPFKEVPVFGLQVPTRCEGVRSDLLEPRRTWKEPEAYDAKAKELAEMFESKYKEQSKAS